MIPENVRLDLEAKIAKIRFYAAQAKKDLYQKEQEVQTFKKNLAGFEAEINRLEAQLNPPEDPPRSDTP